MEYTILLIQKYKNAERKFVVFIVWLANWFIFNSIPVNSKIKVSYQYCYQLPLFIPMTS